MRRQTAILVQLSHPDRGARAYSMRQTIERLNRPAASAGAKSLRRRHQASLARYQAMVSPGPVERHLRGIAQLIGDLRDVDAVSQVVAPSGPAPARPSPHPPIAASNRCVSSRFVISTAPML